MEAKTFEKLEDLVTEDLEAQIKAAEVRRLTTVFDQDRLNPQGEEGIFELIESYKTVAKKLLEKLPGTRERSLAMTNLEQSLLWALETLSRY